MKSCFVLLLLLAAAPIWGADRPFIKSELIFPLGALHSHSSSIVQLPSGDFYACWYKGSGERTADDVKVEASLLRRNGKAWSPPYTLVDQPGLPDTNPILFMDSHRRLWLSWSTILANRWETGLLRYKTASRYAGLATAPPKWDVSEPLLFVPRNFAVTVKQAAEPGRGAGATKLAVQMAADKYFSRMGWMARNHPLELPSGRILIPLYSDGYDFSLIAITDDSGRTWTGSEPLVSRGGVQPSLVRKKDGTIVAYMRDNGPPPKRVLSAESKDDGITWSTVVDTDIPNPGSSLEVIALREGVWALVNNDTVRGRHSLLVSLSEDEGKTWKWRRHIERDTTEKNRGSYHYPSVIQARDGSLHVTYSFSKGGVPRGEPSQSIKHARFNIAWVKQGD
jgi:predicted neuraminidase